LSFGGLNYLDTLEATIENGNELKFQPGSGTDYVIANKTSSKIEVKQQMNNADEV